MSASRKSPEKVKVVVSLRLSPGALVSMDNMVEVDMRAGVKTNRSVFVARLIESERNSRATSR